MLEAVRQSGARLIFASSCEVYGDAESSPVSESAELCPHSPSTAFKAGADRMCFAYHKVYGVDVTIVRPCNVYGTRQKSGSAGAVIPIFVSLGIAGKPLTVFGRGHQSREYIHVRDVVRAYDLILNRNDHSGMTLNVGTSESPIIAEIAAFVSDYLGVPVFNEPARAGEVRGFWLNSTRINNLGFSPIISFWDGLAGYIEELRSGLAVSDTRPGSRRRTP